MRKVQILCVILILNMFFLVSSGNAKALLHTHEFGEWEVVKESTCFVNGRKVRYCSCGEEESDSIPVTNHVFDQGSVQVAQTCLVYGYATYTCTLCDFSIRNVISSSDHVGVTVIPGWDPTCTEMGVGEGKYCSACGDMLIHCTRIPPLGHNTEGAEAVMENRVEPTCTTEGRYDMVVRCCTCGDITESRRYVIPITPHNVESYTSNNDAKCGIDGTKTGNCTVCHQPITVTDEGSALEHKMPEDTNCGEMWICENGCGETFGPREHAMSSATSTTPATCTNCGYTEE